MNTRKLSIVAVWGVILGYAFGSFYYAFAFPNFNAYLMDLAQYNQVNMLPVFPSLPTQLNEPIIYLCCAILWYFGALRINPELGAIRFNNIAQQWKPSLVLVLSGLAIFLAIVNYPGRPSITGLSEFVLMIVICWVLLASVRKEAPEWGVNKSSFLYLGNTATLGVLFAGFLIGAIAVIQKISALYFTVLVEAFDSSFETSPFGWNGIYVGFMLVFTISVVVAIEFAGVFRPGGYSLRQRGREAKFGLAVLGFIAVLMLAISPYATSTLHVSRADLAEAASLEETRPMEYTLLRFCGDDECSQPYESGLKTKGSVIQTGMWTRHVEGATGFGVRAQRAPLNTSVPAQLEQFVLNDGRRSIFRNSAIGLVSAVQLSLWQPYEAFHSLDNLERKGGLPYGLPLFLRMQHVSWLGKAAPITDKNRQDVMAFSDSSRFHVGGAGAKLLADAWLRFGNKERAAELYNIARNTAKYSLEISDNPAVPAMNNGQIHGTISATDMLAKGVRIGLFVTGQKRLRNGKKADSEPAKLKSVIPYPDMSSHLVDSQELAEDGRFRFTHLPEGSYALALLVPADVLASDAVLDGNVPGIIRLEAKRPVLDLGGMRLQKRNPDD
ncbi:MAG: hypothetical protein OEZ10_09875 [Gammaproteobacteria bacterium]|nr:hypothetical protein [Gammaproteobacteria bacterium]